MLISSLNIDVWHFENCIFYQKRKIDGKIGKVNEFFN